MAVKKVFSGSVDYIQVLDENGAVDKALEKELLRGGLGREQLIGLYRCMVTARVLDEKAINLQRQGRMLTYAPCRGEEAITVGTSFALRKDDWVVPAYREQGMYIVMGVPLKYFLMYFMGFEEGNHLPREFNITPVCVPVATHFLHAAGIGMAMKHKGENKVVMTYTGDGGSSEGDFYEALNFAGVYGAPVVFVVRNNQWAISVPRKKQTAAKTIAQKGIAAGIRCVQADGNDVLAMYYTAKIAVDAARKGEGPTLIEAVSYRMGMHTTADDPKRYMPEDEIEMWKKKDPIERFRKYLKAKRIWNEVLEKKIIKQAAVEVEHAVEEAEAFRSDYTHMFKNVYARMPAELEEQLEDAGRFAR
ncbi:MAG: pyruvate dehydrogenase (acetyl-transferring) E1 component subunit alpha [Candidatus Micrarchaeota archaeon]|nr:pyruvate dehydrogenase (acetyl-transferring) E1 component subunit alpha [Candidatus Micrarchaeota archaeon]